MSIRFRCRSNGVMEVLQTSTSYIILDNDHSLHCSRLDGTLTPKFEYTLSEDFECIGTIHGVIGKIKTHPESFPYLLVIANHENVGCLPPPANQEVFVIKRVVAIPLAITGFDKSLLPQCTTHSGGPLNLSTDKSLQKTWNAMKATATNIKIGKRKSPTKEAEKIDARLVEEILRMFNDQKSFYYTPYKDLTKNLERYVSDPESTEIYDDFFFNKYMLKDLFENDFDNPVSISHWVVPIICGYYNSVDIVINYDEVAKASDLLECVRDSYIRDPVKVQVSLLSRRSRKRAGTRYKRRGGDPEGNVANFVETEMFMSALGHTVSFVQIRGSIPLLWSQSGTKYKPIPVMEGTEEENDRVFQNHFSKLLSNYQNKVVIVNLVEQQGREKILVDAFSEYVLRYNNEYLFYVTFDFHSYCRGRHFENVRILLQSLLDVIRNVKYTWADSNGLILRQNGVFRVNCVDCLDRTNLVQSAIARVLFETQLRKLGLLLPEERIPEQVNSVFNGLWADNGDILSRQYAGTAALKGDFTRTGERKWTGIVKDGKNSAERYYLNRFRDTIRQAGIDIMCLGYTNESVFEIKEKCDNDDVRQFEKEKLQYYDGIIEQTHRIIVPVNEEFHGGWPIIILGEDVPVNDEEPNGFLFVSDFNYFIVYYDESTERVNSFIKLPIGNLTLLEFGQEASLLSSTKKECLRVHYTVNNEEGYFHTFRPLAEDHESIRERILLISSYFARSRALNSLGTPMKENKICKMVSRDNKNVVVLNRQTKLIAAWNRLRHKKINARMSKNSPFSNSNMFNRFAKSALFQRNSNSKSEIDSGDCLPMRKSVSSESFDNISIGDITTTLSNTSAQCSSVVELGKDFSSYYTGILFIGAAVTDSDDFTESAVSRTVSESSLFSAIRSVASSLEVIPNSMESPQKLLKNGDVSSNVEIRTEDVDDGSLAGYSLPSIQNEHKSNARRITNFLTIPNMRSNKGFQKKSSNIQKVLMSRKCKTNVLLL